MDLALKTNLRVRGSYSLAGSVLGLIKTDDDGEVRIDVDGVKVSAIASVRAAEKGECGLMLDEATKPLRVKLTHKIGLKSLSVRASTSSGFYAGTSSAQMYFSIT